MTLLERFKLLMGAFLVEEWQARAEWPDDAIRGFLEHGMPIEYARELADLTKGRVPIDFWPKMVHPPKALHKRLRSSTVNEQSMHKDHRLAISEGHRGDADPFSKAIRAKGYSQNTLAKAIGVNQAVLSLHRSKARKIPKSRAEAIAKLTGWPADARHWPCGIVTDGE